MGCEKTAVVIMAKQPRVGYTKTRLCPPLRPEQAAQVSEALLKDTIALVHDLGRFSLVVAITPPGSEPYFEQITPSGTRLLPVTGADIGACLEQSLNRSLELGFRKALALNADGPSLPPEYLVRADALLEAHDLVFGPGEDGGYYLVGVKQPAPQLFRDIPWSTGLVLQRTVERAQALGLSAALTPPWYDVDRIHDLTRLKDELESLPARRLIHCREILLEIFS